MALIGTSSMRTWAVVLAAACWLPEANAEVVLPGQSNVAISESSFDFDAIEQKTRNFTFGDVSGQVIDSVISVNGFLAFETQILILSAPSGFLLDQVSRTNYAGFTTNAQPEPDRGGVLFPETANRSNLPGSTVTFNFLANERVPAGGSGSS